MWDLRRPRFMSWLWDLRLPRFYIILRGWGWGQNWDRISRIRASWIRPTSTLIVARASTLMGSGRGASQYQGKPGEDQWGSMGGPSGDHWGNQRGETLGDQGGKPGGEPSGSELGANGGKVREGSQWGARSGTRGNYGEPRGAWWDLERGPGRGTRRGDLEGDQERGTRSGDQEGGPGRWTRNGDQ